MDYHPTVVLRSSSIFEDASPFSTTLYRSDGTAQGKVLFGIKVPDTERPALEQALNSTEMQWEDMTDTMAFKLLYGCERSGACEVNFGADEKLTPP